MAKESGLGWTTLSVDNAAGTPNAIKNDVTNLQFATPRGVQDVTGIDKNAYERLPLLADFSCTCNGVFNDAANLSHDTFKTVSSSNQIRTVLLVVSGDTLTNECIATDYALTRATGGELTWAVPLVLADGTVPTWS
jgi:hypothetical protein